MSMNAEIKAQWTAALRSGEYVQGYSQLRKDNEFCCLGVLCDLGVKAGIVEQTGTSYLGDAQYGLEGNDLHLPVEVKQWAGLMEANPTIDPDALRMEVRESGEEGGGQPSLAWANDNGATFAEIADLIEEQL